MEGVVSFLRKQQSRLLCACSYVPLFLLGQRELGEDTFWTAAFAGMTRLARLGFISAGLSTARVEVNCFIRLKCYPSGRSLFREVF